MLAKRFYAKSRKDWRGWLRKNHKIENKVYLIKYKKHTGRPSVTNRESLEEAICFGWIDTTVKRLDDKRYQQCFVRRTDKSRWSSITLRYARELIKAKKMSKEGLKRYHEGLKKGVIDHGLPRNPDIPLDLKNALEKNKKAKENFINFAPSYRRVYLYWLHSAKLAETRKRRIKAIVSRSAQNRKWGI